MVKIDQEAMNQIMAEQDAALQARTKARQEFQDEVLSVLKVDRQWVWLGGVWVDSTRVVAVGNNQDGDLVVFTDGGQAFIPTLEVEAEQVLIAINYARLSARRYT